MKHAHPESLGHARILAGAPLLAALLLTAAAGAWPGAAEAECGCLEHRLERAAMAGLAFPPGEGAGAVYDATNGRDHRNFPPDPLVDYRKMRLALRFDEIASGRFTGTQQLTVAAIGLPVPLLTLDAPGLSVKRVIVDGTDAEWSHDGKDLAIRFTKPLQPAAVGATAKASVIEIVYEADRPTDGITFSPATPEIPGVAPARGAQVHTQGETETNRFWFPIHDFPNIRLPTELIVDVPAGLQVSANGALISHETENGRELWHWNQEKPHAPYLVSLVIGDFDRVTLPAPLSHVPMTVWAPKGRGADAEASYANTDRMIALFEKRFGTKYPWARYDQLIVRNFGAGGMENTSVTTMHPSAVMDATARAEGDLDGLISHELCHQWTGDFVTCRSWEHIWLNEGWATYGSALWFEERDGADGYYDTVLGNAGVAQRDVAMRDATTPNEAMCSPVYKSAEETFRRPANPYPKGSSILHMLRRMLGDQVFFRGVQSYMATWGLRVAETPDFRHAMEQASGRDLEWFFDQWCYRPGSPHVKATAEYDAATRTLTVRAEQVQAIDARTPALRISMPVWVKTSKGEVMVPLEMRDRTAVASAVLDGAPVAVWVDPYLDALKTIEVTQPEAWTLATLRGAPTIAARRQALAELGKVETPAARAALLEIARDNQARYTLRTDAVRALGKYGSPEAKAAVVALAKERIADPRVRDAIVSRLADCPREEAVPLLVATLAPRADGAGEQSYAVRSSAIDALSELGDKECIALVRAQVEVPSHGDAISQSALAYLGKFGDASDIERIQARAALGIADRTRPAALGALAKLAPRLKPEERAKVEEFLLVLVDDPESRVASSAGGALAELKCKAALDRLRAIADHDKSPQRRTRAQEWVKRIAG